MPGSAEDFEEAWAQIVADLSADLPSDLSADLSSDLSAEPPSGVAEDLSRDSGDDARTEPSGRSQRSGMSPENGDQAPSATPSDPSSGSPAEGARADDLPGDDAADPERRPPAMPRPTESPDAATTFEWGFPQAWGQEQPEESSAPDPGAFVDNWADEGHYQPPPPPELPAGTPAKRLAWAGVLGGPATLLLSALTPWNPPPIVALGAGLATVAGFIALVWMLPENRDDGWDDGARV